MSVNVLPCRVACFRSDPEAVVEQFVVFLFQIRKCGCGLNEEFSRNSAFDGINHMNIGSQPR